MTTHKLHILLALALGLAMVIGTVALLGAQSQEPADVRARTAGVLTVCKTGPPDCDYAVIQDAVDAAVDGDVIKVAAGVYTDVRARPVPAGYPYPPPGGLITQVLYISKTVTIQGGYTTTNYAGPADPETNPTTLDAQGQGRVVVIGGEISPMVEGLRITGGYALPWDIGGEPSGDIGGAGGGLYAINATATIRNNRVFDNDAILGGGIYLLGSSAILSGNVVHDNSGSYRGGGLYLDHSPATVGDNTVYSNNSQDGGGIYLRDSDAKLTGNMVNYNGFGSGTWHGGGFYLYRSNATLTGNTVISNKAGYGGGLYLDESDAILTGNTISNSVSDLYGGGLYLYQSDATLTSNTVTSNSVGSCGGGLYLDGSNATLNDNSISLNSTEYGDGGGGLYSSDSNAILNGNRVISNTTNGNGGGAYLLGGHATLSGNVISFNQADGMGGGLFLSIYEGSARLSGNTISFNRAEDMGGGIHLRSPDAALINNLITDNQTDPEGYSLPKSVGSGLYVDTSRFSVGTCSVHLLHTTVARNTGGYGIGVMVSGYGYGSHTVHLTNTVLVSHTVGISVATGNTATLQATLWGEDPWANETDWGGDGTILTGTVNIWHDPAFVHPDSGNYHIGLGSGAIDKGVDAGVHVDIDGQARPQYAGYDLGADEHTPITDLRVARAITSTGLLTATLHWTTLPEAVTTTLRYSNSRITDDDWTSAAIITDALPGSADSFTATVPYEGGSTFFALKVQAGNGAWSELSNNAYWPRWDVYLPLTLRDA